MINVRKQLGNLLAADTTTLAPATANKIALVASNVSPNENLTISSLTFATFTGSTPIAAGTGSMIVTQQPGSSQQVITIKSPAGGWLFSCTVAPSVAETIYGFALTDNAGAVLLGYDLLPTPVVIANVGDFIDLGSVEMVFVPRPIS